jgi:uncharacterized membrane protein
MQVRFATSSGRKHGTKFIIIIISINNIIIIVIIYKIRNKFSPLNILLFIKYYYQGLWHVA